MMTGNNNSSFLLLNKHIQFFIKSHLKWKELSPIQEKTIPSILNQNNSLIIAPTASGKTEAVLLPVINEILNDSLSPMSVLYVSPLKALINDMYIRIDKWGNFFGIEVTKWHGDVSLSKKKSFLKSPSDFLLITPESLEIILMNKSEDEKNKIFKNLKYIIIDEIHYFVESDRGTQLNSIINRIKRYNAQNIVKIGLSATVGNPELVSKWMDINNPAKIIKTKSDRDFYYRVLCGFEQDICKNLKKYSNDKKILIFTHSRAEAEKYNKLLKRELNINNIFIHHSSIDKKIREENEEKFKNFNNGFMISTSTLELGIDIGDIWTAVQIKPPNNVSSFSQRIGRSGRRTKVQTSIIFYKSDIDIFISLAELLMFQANKIENIKIPNKPKDIYFHQILSTIFEYNNKISKKDLYYKLKNCFVFHEITKKEFSRIINHMEEIDFIEKNKNFLTLGYSFEKKLGKRNFLDFYTVFCPTYEYKIMDGGKTMGTVDPTFALTLRRGDGFVLGGNHWIILEINYNRFIIKVKKDLSHDGNIPVWYSGAGSPSSKITRKIYDILLGNFNEDILVQERSFFDEESITKIKEYVDNAQKVGFKKGIVPVEIDETGRIYIYTFGGFKMNALLSMIFKIYHDAYFIKDSAFYSSFKLRKDKSFEDILYLIENLGDILNNPQLKYLISDELGKFYKNKFINFLPYEDNALLKMEILYDEKGLVNLFKENHLELIESSKFKEW